MLRDVTSVALAGAEMDAQWAREELRRRYLFPSEAGLDSKDDARPSGEAPRALVQGPTGLGTLASSPELRFRLLWRAGLTGVWLHPLKLKPTVVS